MTGLGRCIRPNCTTAAIRTLGAEALCPEHVEAVLAPIRARVLGDESNNGIGRQVGPLLDDWGAGWAILRCDACSATWGGVVGDPCSWCIDRAETLLVEQRRLVLTRPGIDPSDAGYNAANCRWALRLANAVNAGLITERAARSALAHLDRLRS